jgi:hypothetical protein
MDGRITHAKSSEGRIAAVCRSLIIRMAHPVPDRPDYADLNEWLKIYLTREFLMERIDEWHQDKTPERHKYLMEELVHIERRIDDANL